MHWSPRLQRHCNASVSHWSFVGGSATFFILMKIIVESLKITHKYWSYQRNTSPSGLFRHLIPKHRALCCLSDRCQYPFELISGLLLHLVILHVAQWQTNILSFSVIIDIELAACNEPETWFTRSMGFFCTSKRLSTKCLWIDLFCIERFNFGWPSLHVGECVQKYRPVKEKPDVLDSVSCSILKLSCKLLSYV